ncbi:MULTISPECIES: TIM-barrel domain-containing protein [unclassified Microbacterium]|uniref:glycoside hydrolase family 31 protein n=1 Tax=unclassified Microbacterium TaxID=2609290 RepID=UPI000EA9531B|nr:MULTISPECIES: TIM-barrel domain-containing protein [unclassified Microbacterium]MBT2484708.1 glycoside hydrolase [Microbacterium sp. ISL-108]RKN67592.1 glycoside hydrolase [Microbacterium sp. CGR2]
MQDTSTIALSDGAPAPANPEGIVRGPGYRITVLTDRLFRIEWDPQERFVDEKTQTVLNRAFPAPRYEVVNADRGVEIITDSLHLRYDGRTPSSSGLSVTLLTGATDVHYATWRYGQEYPQALPLRGNLGSTARTLDEVDGAIEIPPGLLSTFGFGTLDDSASLVLGEDGWIHPRAGGGEAADLYFFGYGRDFSAALRDFHALTGPIPLVPRFALGNWWSRYWAYDEAAYLGLMRKFRDNGIPLSVAVIDMDWHVVAVDPSLGTGWTGYTWNAELFPDPERFLAKLHSHGLAVTLNLHPADGIRRHEESYDRVAEAMGVDPAIGAAIGFDVSSRRFMGAYLEHVLDPLEDQGVDFWWIDWQSGAHSDLPGLDPLWMLNHVHFHASARHGRRPLTFSRYTERGGHRYPVGFSGDTIVSWGSLAFQPEFTATAANAGYTWWSHDIGGHMHGDHDVELAVRWLQFGVLSPINRLHSSTNPFSSKEPWAYGEPAAAIMGRFMRLRHRLIPMLYTAAWAAHAENVSVVRPLYHDAPREHGAYTHPNQYLLGEHLLVAPITAPRERRSHLATVRAWLPEGEWVDVFTGLRYRGSREVALTRPLELYPVLARAGAVVPLDADPMSHAANAPETMELLVVPGTGRSTLAEDDGSAEPERGIVTFRQTLDVRGDGKADIVLTMTHSGARMRERRIALRLPGVRGVESAIADDGRVLRVDTLPADAEALAPAGLGVDLGAVDPATELTVRIVGAERAHPFDRQGVFELLQRSEIGFEAKRRVWSVVETGGPVAEISGLDLPRELSDAVNEYVTSLPAW